MFSVVLEGGDIFSPSSAVILLNVYWSSLNATYTVSGCDSYEAFEDWFWRMVNLKTLTLVEKVYFVFIHYCPKCHELK